MPLLPGKSKEVIGKNIETEIKTEKDPKQAAAIAYSEAGESKKNESLTHRGYKIESYGNNGDLKYKIILPNGKEIKGFDDVTEAKREIDARRDQKNELRTDLKNEIIKGCSLYGSKNEDQK